MFLRRRSCSSAAKADFQVNQSRHDHPFGGKPLVLSLLASVIFGACLFDDHDKLLADAKSDREEVRAQAIKRISEDPWPNDDAVLFQAASDPSSMVRLVVAEALWASEDPRVQNLLATFLNDEVPEIQRFAIQGLLRKPTAKNLAYLRNAYLKQGWATRRIIGELVSVDQLKGFIQSEAEMLKARHEEELQQNAPPRQESAARKLGQSGSPESVAPLMAILDNPASPVAALAGAADGLAKLNARQAIPKLIQILVDEPQPALQSAVMGALAAFGDSSAVAPLMKIVEENGESSREALSALVKMAAPGAQSSETAKSGICQLILKATPGNADDLAVAASQAKATCDLTSVVHDLNLGGTATLAALKVLARLPVSDPEVGAKLLVIFEAEDSEPEIVAQTWRTLGPLAAQNEAIQAALTKKLDAHFATYAQAHEKWLPATRIHGLWPKDEFAQVNLMAEDEDGDGHHHHAASDDDPEIDLEELQKGTNLDAKDLERMINAQKDSKLKGKGKKKGFVNLMEKLDKAAKARTEALGMKPGTDLSKVFAYGGDIVPDDSRAGDDIYAGMISALAYMPTYPLSSDVLGSLWSSFQTRRAVCELAGARYGVKPVAVAPVEPSKPADGNDKTASEATAAPEVAKVEASQEVVAQGQAPQLGDAVAQVASDSSGEVAVAPSETAPTVDKAPVSVLEMEDRSVEGDEIVLRCLRSRIQEDQEAVLRGLMRRGAAAAPAIEAALAERSEQRAPLLEALGALGNVSDAVVEKARSWVVDGGADGMAALSLVVAAKDDSIVPQLIDSLDNPALRERAQVIDALGALGDGREDVVSALTLELYSESADVRAATLRALRQLGKLNVVFKAQALTTDYSSEVRQLVGVDIQKKMASPTNESTDEVDNKNNK